MSDPVNEAQARSASPSHARHTSSSTSSDSERERTYTGGSNVTRQREISNTALTSDVSLNREYPLHEFHSLLEAAQRIASSAPFDTEGDRWREDDQPEPIIHLNRRRTAAELSSRRAALRAYTSRPHVPGEDSGSEGESEENEINSIMDTSENEDRRANRAWLIAHGAVESDTDTNPAYVPPSGGDPEPLPPRPDQGRTRDRQQEEEEERDLLEQALARSRAARSRFEADNQRSHVSSTQRTRYSTTGALPTSQSFYDWAPEPTNNTDTNTSVFRSRSRASSIRRWRPAERLQDYASNNARRDSVNATPRWRGFAEPQSPAQDPIPPLPELGTSTVSSRPTDTNLGSHEDVVDRVERALQQYRIARRALRPLNVDVAFEAIPSSNNSQSGAPRASGNDAPSTYAEQSDSRSTTQNGTNTLASMDDVGFTGRTEPYGFGSRDYSSPSLRWAPSGLTRREDPLRQRIREQIRERRRRGAQQALEVGNHREMPLARGPLFESAGTPQFAVPSDARQMIDRVRRAGLREQSPEFKRAKGALQYLSRLRDSDVDDVKAWTLAAELGLHNQGLEEVSHKNIPLSVDSLPTTSYSSWLEPGTTWTGVQDANDPGENSTRSVMSSQESDRDNAQQIYREQESFYSRMRSIHDPLERTFLPRDDASDPTSLATSSIRMLERADETLSSMLERSEELLRENDRQLQDNNEQLRQSRERLRDTDRRLTLLDDAVRRRAEARARQVASANTRAPTASGTGPESDWWNVKVTLHSVDERQMIVSGTMTASHKLHRPSYNGGSSTDDPADGGEQSDASMDSFFTGEIIDFARHGLDTPPSVSQSKGSGTAADSRHRRQQDDWKVGGPEVDLSYWAGIGPFKQEIDRVIQAREDELLHAMQVDEQHHEKHNTNSNATDTSSQDPDANIESTNKQRSQNDSYIPISTEEGRQTIKMDTMAKLLSDTKWLNENIGSQGWILMRWKERCFVAPGTEPNPDVRRPWVSGQPREFNSSSNNYHPSFSSSGPQDSSRVSLAELTAIGRMRRRRERDARVWSTNAAEREELASSNAHVPFTSVSGSESQPTPSASSAWGLTISGFYYVALERSSGRIEALYYDCGSTPFQKLKMTPQTCYRVPNVRAGVVDKDEIGQDGEVNRDRNRDDEPVDFSGIVGLKTSFSLVEFR